MFEPQNCFTADNVRFRPARAGEVSHARNKWRELSLVRVFSLSCVSSLSLVRVFSLSCVSSLSRACLLSRARVFSLSCVSSLSRACLLSLVRVFSLARVLLVLFAEHRLRRICSVLQMKKSLEKIRTYSRVFAQTYSY